MFCLYFFFYKRIVQGRFDTFRSRSNNSFPFVSLHAIVSLASTGIRQDCFFRFVWYLRAYDSSSFAEASFVRASCNPPGDARWVAFYLRTKWIPGRRRCQISCFPRSIQLSPLLLRFVRQIRLCARHRQINSRKAGLSIEELPNWNGGACRLSSVERCKWEDNFSRSTSGLLAPARPNAY